MDSSQRSLSILEFYSGIGGMHFAAKASGFPTNVVCAFDINVVANDVYRHNFHDTPVSSRNITGLTPKELDMYHADVFLMSPPCQPYTRQGLQAGSDDPRASSFLAILDIIPKLKNPPRYLLIENVKGFETSETRNETVRVLQSCSYSVHEYLLSPLQCGIPNSRLRYYLLASRVASAEGGSGASSDAPLPVSEILTSLPALPEAACQSSMLRPMVKTAASSTAAGSTSVSRNEGQSVNVGPDPASGACVGAHSTCSEKELPSSFSDTPHSSDIVSSEACASALEPSAKQPCLAKCNCGSDFRLDSGLDCAVQPISAFLDPTLSTPDTAKAASLLLPNTMPVQQRAVLDVVQPSCCHSCCFTKNYGRYARGTGSVLDCSAEDTSREPFALHEENGAASSDTSQTKTLRYFSPREVANLLCFPEEFGFPGSVTTKQQYRCLGNSLNVLVVAWLLCHLFSSGGRQR